jgi:hypothetical protein
LRRGAKRKGVWKSYAHVWVCRNDWCFSKTERMRRTRRRAQICFGWQWGRNARNKVGYGARCVDDVDDDQWEDCSSLL